MDDFSLVGVDHMVIKTKQVDEVTRMFLAQLKFRRVSSDSAEMVRGECRVCVDQLCSNSLSKVGVCSVTDIAFVVTGLESLLTRARAVDARIIVEDISPVLEHPRLGSHRRAVVKVRRRCAGLGRWEDERVLDDANPRYSRVSSVRCRKCDAHFN